MDLRITHLVALALNRQFEELSTLFFEGVGLTLLLGRRGLAAEQVLGRR